MGGWKQCPEFGPYLPENPGLCPPVHAWHMPGNQLISLQFEVSLWGEGRVSTPIKFVTPFSCFHHSWRIMTLAYHTGKCLRKSAILHGLSKVLALVYHHHLTINFKNEFLFSFSEKGYGGRYVEFGVWGWFVFCLFASVRDLSSPKGGLRKIYPLPTPSPLPSHTPILLLEIPFIYILTPRRNKR